MLSNSANKVCGLEDQNWTVDPDTGIVSLTDEALKNLINPDPIEKCYLIDPKPIARGQFTVVYHCRNLITEGEFAAKFSSRWRFGVDCSADLEHEIAICAILRHPIKAVQLADVFSTDSEVVLILEYAPGGDLQTLMDQNLVPFERNVIAFMKQILETLAFIHEKNIVHLDIKPQNLVLMGDYPDCDVKLCDFEISRILLPGHTVRDILGTADYIAPEIIHYEPISTKADMWSFGILAYVLLTGFLPFGGDTDQETFLDITRGKLDFPEELFEDVSDQAIDFIKRLLLRQPHLRMSAKECLNHDWIKSAKTLPKINITSVTPVTSTSLSANLSLSNNETPLQSAFSFTTAGNKFSLSIPSSPSSPQNVTCSQNTSTLNNLSDDKFSIRLRDSLEGLAHSLINETNQQGLGSFNYIRESGLPPLKSYMSNRTSNHSSTSSLSKGGSKQSLDRIRSISKSREILFERLQKSSQRKILSRSRERLYDSKFGICLSKDKMLENRSISHSVETLPPSDLANDCINSFYSSSGNVYALPVFTMLPLVEENNINCRQYKSMAAINNIEGDYEISGKETRRKESVHSNFTYATKGYENLLSNKSVTVKKELCGILKHQNSEPETIKCKIIITDKEKLQKNKLKLSNENSKKTTKTISITRSTEKGKRDSQRRRKQNERNNVIKMKENDKITDIYNNNSENKNVKNNKRTSGYNIEQRIQIRRTRKNKANLKTENKVINIRQDNRISEPQKKIVQNRNKLSINNTNISSNNNENLEKISKNFSASTQINSPYGVCVNKPLVPFTHKMNIDKNLSLYHKIPADVETNSNYCKITQNTKKLFPDQRQEIDEVYVSLEDQIDDKFDNKLFEIRPINSDGASSSSRRMSETLQILSLSNISKTKLMKAYNEKVDDKFEEERHRDKLKYEKVKECNRNYDKSNDPKGQDLTVIAEEEETISITSCVRSVSTCSDISSVLSEISEEVLKSRRNSEIQSRRKSLHMHTPNGIFIPDKLSRSKSLHLDSPLAAKVRPWGDLCSGSIDRAFSILSQKSAEFIFVPRKNSDPTSNRPKSIVIEKKPRISFKNTLLKV